MRGEDGNLTWRGRRDPPMKSERWRGESRNRGSQGSGGARRNRQGGHGDIGLTLGRS